jgi:long-chain acyl-CoA synthetase
MEELEKKYNSLKAETASFINDETSIILKEIQNKVNEQLNKFSQIQRVVWQTAPFEKTPTQKIKRFLYYA